MIDGSPSQHHGVIIGPFGSVAPALFVAVPEVAAGWVTNNAVWETLPHCEGEVHLDRDERETDRDRKLEGRHKAKKAGTDFANCLKKKGAHRYI